MIKFNRWPPAPSKRFAAFGLGIILSNDNQLKGLSILLGFCQVNIGFFEAFFFSVFTLMLLILREIFIK